VLRAASRSFLRHGYHTSVDEIARRAGVAPSRRSTTISRARTSCSRSRLRPREATVLVGDSSSRAAEPRRTCLFAALGLAYRRAVLAAEGLAMFRRLTAECRAFKALAKAIYAGGAGEMCGRLVGAICARL